MTAPDVAAIARGFILKAFNVDVRGHAQSVYYARSRGQAQAQAWRDWTECRDCTFMEFMKISRAYIRTPHDRFGEPMTICGEPAFYVSHNSQYIQFVRPDSDVIMNSHPLDVEPPEARRGTPYYQETTQ